MNQFRLQNFYFFIIEPVEINPCNPSPCGSNALCNNGICTCYPEYQGNPYVGCRPECVQNYDCPSNKACRSNKCFDPCIGVCGAEAVCNVYNHVPLCTCPPSLTGDPFVFCHPEPSMSFIIYFTYDTIQI